MQYRDATAKHTDELFEKLSAEDGLGNVGTNVDQTQKGKNPDQYPPPEDRPTGNMDAPWGEPPGALSHGQQPVRHNADVVMKAFREGREELLGKLLDSKKPSDKAEQAVVSSMLDAASSGEFETSSPQLSEKSKMSSAPADETLLQQLWRTTGMR